MLLSKIFLFDNCTPRHSFYTSMICLDTRQAGWLVLVTYQCLSISVTPSDTIFVKVRSSSMKSNNSSIFGYLLKMLFGIYRGGQYLMLVDSSLVGPGSKHHVFCIFFIHSRLFFEKIYYLMIERACKLTIHSESWANFFYFRVKMKLDFAFQKGHNLLCKSWVRYWIFNYVTLLDYTHLPSLKIILKYIIFHNFFYWFWTFLDSNTESIPLRGYPPQKTKKNHFFNSYWI